MTAFFVWRGCNSSIAAVERIYPMGTCRFDGRIGRSWDADDIALSASFCTFFISAGKVELVKVRVSAAVDIKDLKIILSFSIKFAVYNLIDRQEQ